MSLNRVKLGLLSVSLLALTACTSGQVDQEIPPQEGGQVIDQPINEDHESDDDNKQEDPSEEANGDQSDAEDQERSQVIQKLNQLILGGGDSSDSYDYIAQHIHEASPRDADELIRILLIMQSPLIQKGYEGIFYEEGYMEALNESMGGVLDPTKVEAIEDETIRAFYQSLIDSGLTIVRYEETPSVETDWDRIKMLDATYTPTFQMVIDMRDYNRLLREQDVLALTDRVYQMEETLRDNGDADDFASEQLELLYDRYVSALLVGPEGTYLYQLSDPENVYTIQMRKVTDQHSESGFSKTAIKLMEANDDNQGFNHLVEIVDSYRRHNPYQTFNWTQTKTMGDNIEQTLMTLDSGDADLDLKINTAFSEEANQIVKESGVKDHYQLTMYKTYESHQAVTMSYYLNVTREDNDPLYLSHILNVSLETGEILSLNDLLGIEDQDRVLDFIIQETGVAFTKLPSFEMTTTGLMLKSDPNDPSNSLHAVITNDKLYKQALIDK